jgi:long-chain fatty acid transport protein
MRRRLVLGLILLLLPAAAWAGPFEFFGAGARAVAMGGAYAALGDDAAGYYYNIAALTQVHRVQFDVGYADAIPNMTLNGARFNMESCRGVNLGATVSSSVNEHRLSGGIDLFMPDAHMMRFSLLPANQPHSPFFTDADQTLVALAGLGFEVWRYVSLGFGLNMLAGNNGGVDFEINERQKSSGSLQSRVSGLFSPVAGIWSRPMDWLRIGFSYREKLLCKLVLPANIHVPALKVFPGSDLSILRPSDLLLLADAWSHFSPRQFELGLAFEPHSRITVSADLTYMQWSEMKSDAPSSAVYLTGGLADLFPSFNGPSPPPPHFHDTYNPAIGFEGRPIVDPRATLALRAGYRYRPTPVPDQTGFSNYVDSDTHIFSSGFGVTLGRFWDVLPRPVSLDAFAQYQWLTPRTMNKSSAADEVGDLHFSGNWWNFGGSVTLRF